MWLTNGVDDEYDSSSNNIINTSDSDNEAWLERDSWKMTWFSFLCEQRNG